MKYKVGDKVKIKTWKAMEKEFGISVPGVVASNCGLTISMEADIVELDSERIVTISMVRDKDCYLCKELHNWCLSDDMIQEIAVEREKEEITRFELMDI